MKRFLLLIILFLLAAAVLAQTVQSGKIYFDDVAKILSKEDKDAIAKEAVALKHQDGVLFHILTGFAKPIELEEYAKRAKGMCKMGATPDDRTVLLMVLKKNAQNDAQPTAFLVLGNGFVRRIDKNRAMALLEPLQNALQDESTASLSKTLADTYSACVSEIRESLSGNPQPSTDDDDVSSLIVAMATAKPADTAKNAEAQSAPENTEFTGSEQLPDPGVPPPFTSKHPPKPPRKHYACDYADLLTSSDRSRIETLGRALDNACGAEIVIVTVETRGEEAVGQYALSVAKDWGIGKKGDDNGCILFAVKDNLLAHKSGKISIKTGYGLEGCLPDAKCGRILDDIALPPFADTYDKTACSAGLRKAYEALVSEVATEFNAELNQGQLHRLPPRAKRKMSLSKRLELYVKAYVLITVICLVVYFPLGAILFVLPFSLILLPYKNGRSFLWNVLTLKAIKPKYGPSGRSGGHSYDDDSSYDSGDDDDGGDDDDDDYGGGDFGGGGADR